MGKFCTKCGRSLEEGEVCSCQNTEVPQQSIEEVESQLQQQQVEEVLQEVQPQFEKTVDETQPQSQPELNQDTQTQFEQRSSNDGQTEFQQPLINEIPRQQQYQQQVKVSAFGLYLKRFWTVAKKTVKSPASMLKAFVKATDYKVALGFVGVDAIIFSLFITILFGRINSAVSSLSSLLGSIGSMGMSGAYGLSDTLHFPLVKIFFVTVILTFCGACVLAALLLFFTKVIFKYNTNYKQMLCVASAKSLASAPFALIACIVILIVPAWSLYIISFGTLLGYFYVVVAMKGTGIVDEDKLTYILFFSFALMVIITGVAFKVGYKLYLPSAFTSDLNGIRSFRGFGD